MVREILLLFLFSLLLSLLNAFVIPSDKNAEESSTDCDHNIEITLERALQLVRSQQTPSSSRTLRERTSPYDKQAQRLVDLIQSSQSTSGATPPEDFDEEEESTDLDYCQEEFMIGKRVVQPETMRTIIKLRELGRSHQSLKKLYPWYDRRLVSKFLECLTQTTRPRDILETIN